MKDQTHVSIKLLAPSEEDNEGHNEVSIMEYLSRSELRANQRNHAVPLIDTFPAPDNPSAVFLVTPFLAEWDQIPFVRFGEMMDFVKQLLEVRPSV